MITNSSNNNKVEGERPKPVINDIKKSQIVNREIQPDMSNLLADDENINDKTEKNSVKKKRCFKCKKKLPIYFDNKCKCENEFCSNCLPSFSHDCTFDFKKHNRQILAEQNQVVKADKVLKI
jgi:hypothetical protein